MDIRSQNTPATPSTPTTPPPASPPPEMSEPGFEVRPNDIPTDQLNTIYRGVCRRSFLKTPACL